MNKQEKMSLLLDQIIERAEIDDKNQMLIDLSNNKLQQTVGESWMVFHLKALKTLMDEE